MLISMPTETSTIFGAFQAIWLSIFFATGRTSALWDKVLRAEKFASEIFGLQPAPGSCCTAKKFTQLCR
jgi:hypothetical protein